MRQTDKPNFVRLEFDTYGEFLDYVSQDPKDMIYDGHSSRLESGNSGFTGTPNYQTALQLARDGWPQGIAQANKYSSALFAKLSHLVERLDPVGDIEGAGFDVGTYLSGVPECWLRFETTMAEGAGKVIRLLYTCGASAAVDNDVMIKRGAVAAALVQLLEYAGHRVEIFCCPRCSTSDKQGKGYRLECIVKIKDAEQPLDMSRLIFALAHPSMLRRLGFRLDELGSHETQRKVGTVSYSVAPSQDLLDRADIYIDKIRMSQDAWWDSAEKTEKFILENLKKQGVEIAC